MLKIMLLKKSTYAVCMKSIEEKSCIEWCNGEALLDDYDYDELSYINVLYITSKNQLSLLNFFSLHGEYDVLNIHEFSELCGKRCPKKPKKLKFTKENVMDALQYSFNDNIENFIDRFE